MIEATIALTRPVDTFVYTQTTDPLGQPLFEELSYEYATRYGASHSLTSPENKEMKKYPPILFTPPGGAFLLLLRDGEPIAGGAFMQIDKRTVELKRIWTATDYRRQGLSTRVLEELEAEARRRGFTRIYLTTGSRQPEAKNLYLKTGFTPLFDVAVDPAEIGLLAFEKAIDPVVDPNAPKPGVRDRIHTWRQQRLTARAWTMRNPIPRRPDDAAY
ncbi:MAG: GNAT family N-acetyltransferase [Thermomicrobiales bacterium]